MAEIAIRVDGLSKQYRIGRAQPRYRTLRDSLVEGAAAPFRRVADLLRGQAYGAAGLRESLWALKDVSFNVEEGEVVGVIGRNGAGKTTLLKILSRITDPTEGAVDLYGRVGSLLEVGTGFHPELTGRDNVYLNGAILGMRREEIDRRFDEIVAFSEIERFIDTPVKHYSSGMYVRLAFSVAAHLEPEILLVDEVLAVGDAAFRKKCMGKMQRVGEEGRTVFFVSHNMSAITGLCKRCLYLEQGEIKDDGDAEPVVMGFLEGILEKSNEDMSERTDRRGDGRVRLTSVRFLDRVTRSPVSVVVSGQGVVVEVGYRARNASQATLRRFKLGLVFYDGLGQVITVLNSELASNAFATLPPAGTVYCHIPRFPFTQGVFYITANLSVAGSLADQVEAASAIHVEPGDFFGTGMVTSRGIRGVHIDHTWSEELDALPVVSDSKESHPV